MEWYGWLLLAVAAIAIIAFVIVLIFKSRPIVRGLSEEERKALADLERARVEKQLEIEREKTKKLEQIAKDQRDKLKKLSAWYDNAKEKIDAGRQSEFESYLDDPDKLDAELDRLLSSGSDDTPVVIPTNDDKEGQT